ncbi:hypothetical protein [Actinoplanes palleronii]|uniref:Uncharacterized protein n=1 Tax=Actinoplanes palleronii TaxID=113570 RepID=A0ABQ4BJ63_9ACTN|nr:hypothetical protein [Actinoplanes palleronii]GIE70711.1 hypothetical protein Apa02nite_068190 [Actinoplanes palleronii]
MASDLLIMAALLVGGSALGAAGWRMERAARAAHEPLDPEGPAMPLQRYRLRIYDGQYEVLHENNFVVDVDLDSPMRNGILDRQLTSLVQLAQIANEPMDRPVMKVCDYATGKPLLDWVA